MKARPSRSYLSLRQVLTVPYVALVLTLALIIGTLSYLAGSRAVETVSEHHLQEIVARIGQAVDRHIVGSGAVLEAAFPNGMPAPTTIADDVANLRTRFWIATSLHQDPNNYVYYGNRLGQSIGLYRPSMQEGELRIKLDAEEHRTLYRFLGINGELKFASREEKLFDPRERPWYKAGESTKQHTWTAVYIDFRTAELVATRARRVAAVNGEFEGVVATDVSLQRLNDFVGRLDISANGLAFIIEPDGKLIASSASPNVRKLPDGTNVRLSAADSGNPLLERTYAEVRDLLPKQDRDENARALTRIFDGPDGEPIYAAFDRIKDDAGLEWITVVAVPRKDFMHGVTENVLRTALAALVAAVLATLIGMRILNWVVSDLKRITDAARSVGDGDLETPVGVIRRDEIGELAKSFEAMQFRLRTDRLTGLANREAVTRALGKRIADYHTRANAKQFAILFIDLDQFKQVNDALGHHAGDQVLVEIAERLHAALRAADLVARYAGDEFVILLHEVENTAAAENVRLKIEGLLKEPLTSVDAESIAGVGFGGAVGLAMFPRDGSDTDELLKHADRDMYERKFAARSRAP